MKRLFIILFILLWAFPVNAGKLIDATATAVAGCTTANDSVLVDKSGTDNGNDNTVWEATKYVLSATTTITEFTWRACNSGVGFMSVSLYTNSDNKPSTLVTGTAVTGIDISSSTCDTAANFTATLGTPKAGVAAGTYWLVMQMTAGEGKGVYAASAGDRICTSADGVTWGTCIDDYKFESSLSGCQP